MHACNMGEGLQRNICHYLHSSSYFQYAIMVNYGVLLLYVVSLMTGSAIGVPMSPGYCRYQAATPPPYCTTTHATTGYHTTKAAEYYTTTYDAPSYYIEALKYNSAPSCLNKEAEYYTEVSKYYTIKASEYYTTRASEYYTTRASEYYTTMAPEYYTTRAPEYYTTKVSEYYTTKASEYYTTKAPENYTTRAPEYYTTTYAVPAFYTEVSNYYCA